MPPQGLERVRAVGMHHVSQVTIREAVENENVFAFVPPSTAEQQQDAKPGKFSSILVDINAKFPDKIPPLLIPLVTRLFWSFYVLSCLPLVKEIRSLHPPATPNLQFL
jgi:hypothetical protein